MPGGLYYARDFVKAKDDPTAPDAHDLVDQTDTIDEFTITYSKVFLGLNMACISCHDGAHHLEKVNLFLAGKKREDFFGQAAFFGRTRQIMNWENGYQANTEYTVDDKASGLRHESRQHRARSAARRRCHAAFHSHRRKARRGTELRDELARMITGNIQFSRAFTNRIWAELMGFGIVEPVDEFDLARYDPKHPPPAPWTIQPSNPELLDAMAKDFCRQPLQLSAPGANHDEIQRVPALVEFRGRVEAGIHLVLRAQICPHVERGGVTRRHCYGHDQGRAKRANRDTARTAW